MRTTVLKVRLAFAYLFMQHTIWHLQTLAHLMIYHTIEEIMYVTCCKLFWGCVKWFILCRCSRVYRKKNVATRLCKNLDQGKRDFRTYMQIQDNYNDVGDKPNNRENPGCCEVDCLWLLYHQSNPRHRQLIMYYNQQGSIICNILMKQLTGLLEWTLHNTRCVSGIDHINERIFTLLCSHNAAPCITIHNRIPKPHWKD